MDIAVEEPEVSGAAEIAAVLIAAHPHGNSVAVAIAIAIGSGLLFDLRAALSNGCGGGSHSDTIRALCFIVSGALFASAGDDKLVKVWKTDSWRCIRTI
ncbi:hypothetical protein BDA96_10G277200 [Sorghum bicolor]|uniref:Uncharacterized protein n=2 Tax=Sorghum bicolor TaxID=4558 RepID=A0A921Q4F8_SORBI|nr:hypothetical protein BDA96_10G277200 [Sorghum bicolor]